MDRRHGAARARRRAGLAVTIECHEDGGVPMADNVSLTEALAAAQEAARRAATVIESWRPRFEVRDKGRFDFVTDADVPSQKTISEFLLGRFPEHEFLGEEDVSPLRRPGPDSPPTWIVDPIDGTTNYV